MLTEPCSGTEQTIQVGPHLESQKTNPSNTRKTNDDDDDDDDDGDDFVES